MQYGRKESDEKDGFLFAIQFNRGRIVIFDLENLYLILTTLIIHGVSTAARFFMIKGYRYVGNTTHLTKMNVKCDPACC